MKLPMTQKPPEKDWMKDCCSPLNVDYHVYFNGSEKYVYSLGFLDKKWHLTHIPWPTTSNYREFDGDEFHDAKQTREHYEDKARREA